MRPSVCTTTASHPPVVPLSFLPVLSSFDPPCTGLSALFYQHKVARGGASSLPGHASSVNTHGFKLQMDDVFLDGWLIVPVQKSLLSCDDVKLLAHAGA